MLIVRPQQPASPSTGPSLVRSKLLIPSPAGLLHRPDVCGAIEQGLERKLTLISAPAGYGKTSALVDFARHTPADICWYTADERDRDLATFIRYLVAAIGERFSDFGEHTLTALSSSNKELIHDPTAVVGELVNEMIDLGQHFVLVLDNYEALDGALGIGAFTHRLLEILPSNCHIMIGSRALPDVPITQLVARRQLVGLTDENLRFKLLEIQQLLQHSGIDVSPQQAQAIAANAEGWITGVLLLADLLRDTAGRTLIDTDKATAETYDFLAQEVLSRQPPDIQYFLRASAALREVTPWLCREILHIEDSHTLLAEVQRRNLFITRFGKGAAATYRYHNLFREFLHQQLQQVEAERYTELHLRAARYFQGENDAEETVYHYLAAGAYRDAASLMERVAMEWFTRGRVATLQRWIENLPEEVKPQVPRLCLYHSRVLTDRYDYAGAREALSYAEAGFLVDQNTACLAKVHLQRATLALFEGHNEEAIAQSEAALQMLDQDEVYELADAKRHLGRAHVALGHLSQGVEELQAALTLLRQTGSLYDVANVLQDIAHAFTGLGNLEQAALYLNEALGIRRRLGAPVPLAGVLNNLGYLHYLRGEYRRALALYEEGLDAARRGSDPRWQTYVMIGMADLHRDVESYERADLLYESAWRLAQGAEPALMVYLLIAQADSFRWREEYARAQALLAQARQLAEEKDLQLELYGLLPMVEGITAVQSGEVESGLQCLVDAVEFLEQRQAHRELAQARFLLARAHLLAGERGAAVSELKRAIDLMQQVGVDHFAAVEGRHARQLLELGLSEGLAACRTILDKAERVQQFNDTRESVQAVAEDTAAGRLHIYALGEGRVEREGEIVSSSEWQAAMAKELFFYILLHGPLERDAIGAIFWPELPTKKMTDSFHTTLYRVRRALGADAVIVEQGRYRVGHIDYWFDVDEFRGLVERARLLPPHDWQAEDLWRRAAALYQGDFLPEVERLWCVPERESLHEMYIEALTAVGRCHEARKDREGAIEWYKQALEVDELREDVHRHVMRCYAELGRRTEALAQYQRCVEVLQRELDIEPSVETKKIYETIAGEKPG